MGAPGAIASMRAGWLGRRDMHWIQDIFAACCWLAAFACVALWLEALS